MREKVEKIKRKSQKSTEQLGQQAAVIKAIRKAAKLIAIKKRKVKKLNQKKKLSHTRIVMTMRKILKEEGIAIGKLGAKETININLIKIKTEKKKRTVKINRAMDTAVEERELSAKLTKKISAKYKEIKKRKGKKIDQISIYLNFVIYNILFIFLFSNISRFEN